MLRDVVEDSEWTLEDLRAKGFSKRVVSAIDRLTRRENEAYDPFVERASGDPLARRVKVADLEDNMDIRRTGRVKKEYLKRFRRYYKAWVRLTAGK